MENRDNGLPHLCPHGHGEMARASLKAPGLGAWVLAVTDEELRQESRETYGVGAWLCPMCGHIELYAHVELSE